MEKSMDICRCAAEASTIFEMTNTDLKRKYILHNIELYNHIVSMVDGSRGSFGTGYPFYALGKKLIDGGRPLPIIDEQLRYNNELISSIEASGRTEWPCFNCLLESSEKMPDLKIICRPCPHVEDALKPRKIINRLPDIDMWMICKDSYIDVAKNELTELFDKYHLQPSDITPIQTIVDIAEITESLKNGVMPSKLLPLDAHIIGYDRILELIEQVPLVLKKAEQEKKIPYLPIHPLSYRKVWQYDDSAYNFIFDYFATLTEFNFEENLQQVLSQTRKDIALHYSPEELYYYLMAAAQDSTRRRFETPQLQKVFNERIESWKK